MKFPKDTHKTLHYWGYEPASAENKNNLMLPRDERMAIREQLKAETETIKAAGMRPSKMGYRAAIAAIGAARRIEAATGVELRIFQHDYF